MIKRTFQNIPDGKIREADQQPFLIDLGWVRGSTWDVLLESKRVLVISEAGAGKTYECRSQAKRLWDAGEAAFFLELTALSSEEIRNLLDEEEETRFDDWLSSQSEIATFFLDSIDELKLSLGSFERALKRFKKSIGNQLHRARIVITTRPIPFDGQLVRRVLPVPPVPSSESNEEKFAKIAMRELQKQPNNGSKDDSLDWRTVALMPLSDEQIVEFCRRQGVSDPDVLFDDLRRRNALEFARRPQDLIELCADWHVHKRIRTHSDQVATNIHVKLLPHNDRAEPAELSVEKAIEGASRLALASQMTRRLTIRHSAASDSVNEEAALDPAFILSDWQPNELKALLERPLFGFASYGRVRFHHRSVTEYLSAQRLLALRKQGMPFRALKRLLFAETKGKTIVRPSKRSVAGWLALQNDGIFELLRDNEPAVLLNEGDPESLSQLQRNQALRAYVDCYGPGGWRGLRVPDIQVHRFASNELADEINSIWQSGVENPEVRIVLISLIEAGRIEACADIAFNITQNIAAPVIERIAAIDALAALNDERLGNISASIADGDDLWPKGVARGAVLRLFPKYMSVGQLCRTLRWQKQEKRDVSDLSWQLPRIIAKWDCELPVLEELRDGLLELVSEGLRWRKEWPHISSDRPHLSGALAATCERGLELSLDEQWLYAGALALRLHHRDYSNDKPIKSLHERLSNLNAEDNARLFWVEDTLIQSLHKIEDPWKRFAKITINDGPTELRPNRDQKWVREALADRNRDTGERAMLLEAALRLTPNPDTWKEHVEGLRTLVADNPSFVQKLDDWLKPSEHEKEHLRWEKKQAERNKQQERRKAKDRASWIQLWRDVANQPNNVFSINQSWSTAWNLWLAMRNEGEDSNSSGWNRSFIEEQFNKETADKLRRALMKIWRNDSPSLPSERPENERNTFLVRWQLGLTAIYAEAEDAQWAASLSVTEAERAARYVLLELNGFPHWIERLGDAHPTAIDQTLGNELSWELSQPLNEQEHSSLLHGIEHASENVARLFLPRLASWLDSDGDIINGSNYTNRMIARVKNVTRIILKHGSAAEFENLRKQSLQKLQLQLPIALHLVWLSTLMRIDPETAVEKLEDQIKHIEPSANSEAVTYLASLFGDHRDGIDLSEERFTPKLLHQLTRLAYRHIRIEDDEHHEGVWTPTTRDEAERARHRIEMAMFNAKGEEGFAAKFKIATDPLCAHFKDRFLAIAHENWAQEIDSEVFDEFQAVTLDRTGEAPVSSNEAMFAILRDRLSDLDDLLLGDKSPREAWAGISDEKIMRREIARELSYSANSIYTVDQEAVTADEKETDIRLRSVASPHEAVIELKLGDGRSAKDLLDTIENQLFKKYMASEHCRAGALLVTLAKTRKWIHPTKGHHIDVDQLFSLLRMEARRIEETLGGAVAITVHFLDLRQRLRPERRN